MNNDKTDSKVVAIRMPKAMRDFVIKETGVNQAATAVYAYINLRMQYSPKNPANQHDR